MMFFEIIVVKLTAQPYTISYMHFDQCTFNQLLVNLIPNPAFQENKLYNWYASSNESKVSLYTRRYIAAADM